MKRKTIKFLSIFLSAVVMITCVAPGLTAFGATYTIGILNSESEDVTEKTIMLEEAENADFTVKFINCSQPNGSSIVWTAENPLIASVDSDGKIRAHDSSKQALVQLWIDNNIKSIRGAGPSLGEKLENVMKDLKTEEISAEEICAAFDPALSDLSQENRTELFAKLTSMLEKGYVDVTASLVSYTGETLASAPVHVQVNKSTQTLGNTLPNGTYITNKESLPKTVAVGTSFKLQSVITPVRLDMTTNWSVATDSIWDAASAYAEIEDGVITFKKAGTVTVTASPEFELFLSKMIDFVEGAGDEGTEMLAKWLIEVLGIDISQSTMVTVLSYAIKLVLKLTGVSSWISGISNGNKILKLLSNYLMKASTNDKITFKIVDELPLQSFDISCSDSYVEGDREQLYVTDITPGGALTGETTWSLSDPSVASVSSDGYLKILDAGSDSGVKTVTVSAVLNGITVSKDFKVYGKNAEASDIEITGPSHIDPGTSHKFTAKVYPQRAEQSVQWGVKAESGEIIYATASQAVSDGTITVSADGTVKGLKLGVSYMTLKASNGLTQTVQVNVGDPVSGVSINGAPSVTYKVPVYNTYNETVRQLSATVYPETAANPALKWSIKDAVNLELTADGKVSPIENKGAYGTVTVTTVDGGYKDTIQVAFANVPVTGISLDPESKELLAGENFDISAKILPNSTLSSATIKDVVWSSSDEDVAFAAGGTVYGIDRGTATITCRTRDGLYEAVCTVEVFANKTNLKNIISLSENLDLNTVEADEEKITAFKEALAQAKAVDADDSVYQFTVDAAFEELVSAYEDLKPIISAETIDITKDGVICGEYITQSVDLLENYKDSSLQLGFSTQPYNAMIKSVEWTSSNPKVFVDSTGKVSPLENEACYSLITVTATDYHGIQLSKSIYVSFAYVSVTNVKFDQDTLGGLAGETGKINATVEPTGTMGLKAASIDDLMWVSSDEKVVTVDDDGTLHYIAPGTATVTATSYEGGKSATCNISVNINKTRLFKKILEANALDSSVYTKETFDIMLKAKEQAYEVYRNASADQQEIDAMTDVLTAAINQLVIIRAVTKVELLYNGSDAGDYITKAVESKYVDTTLKLGYALSPTDTTLGTVTFTSSNPDITVNDSGVCRPVTEKGCYAEITVTVKDYAGNIEQDKVNVAFAKNPASRAEIYPSTVTAQSVNAAPVKLSSTVYSLDGANASIQDVTWVSENESVASVDQNGRLTYHDSGIAVISVYTADGNFKASASVTVLGDKSALASAIKTADDATIEKSDYTYESYTVFEEAYNEAVEVNNSFVYSQAEIDLAAEKLTKAFNALKLLDTVTNIVITKNGEIAPEYNTVKVSLSSSYKKASATFGYIIYPESAEYKSVEWTSSNSKIGVDQNGKVSPTENSSGAAMITLTVTDYYGRQYSKSFYVAFANYPVTGISLNKSTVELSPGQSADVSYSVTPSGTLGMGDASVKSVKWSSSNENVATVTDGKITAVDSGEARISCTTLDGGKTVFCTVYVTANKTELYETIMSVKNYTGELYTAESYAIFTQALDNAQKVYDDKYATLEDISSATMAIKVAVSCLKYKTADYTSVDKAIDRYKALYLTRYTADSVELLEQTVAAVEYDLPITRQADVNAMADNINSAIDSLVRNESSELVAKEGSGAVVDIKNNFVYGVAPGTKDLTNLLEATNGGTLVIEQTAMGLGTGTVIKLYNSDFELIEIFKLVIFGDVDGDGWCDGQDAYLATIYANGWLHDEAAEYAADVNHDGYINERDFETMQKAGLLLKEIDQNKTEQELSEDSSYIEYTSLISQTVPVNPDMSLLQVINEFIAKIIEFIKSFILTSVK